MVTLFTGTGRCGTAYLAHYLTAAGYPCGHEALFNPLLEREPWEFGSVVRESSWVGQLYLEQLELEIGVRIIHLVRDPRDVYSSFMSRGFFQRTAEANSTRWWHQRAMDLLVPGIFDQSPEEACARWILGTHRRLADYPKVYLHRDLLTQLYALGVIGRVIPCEKLWRVNTGPGEQYSTVHPRQ